MLFATTTEKLQHAWPTNQTLQLKRSRRAEISPPSKCTTRRFHHMTRCSKTASPAIKESDQRATPPSKRRAAYCTAERRDMCCKPAASKRFVLMSQLVPMTLKSFLVIPWQLLHCVDTASELLPPKMTPCHANSLETPSVMRNTRLDVDDHKSAEFACGSQGQSLTFSTKVLVEPSVRKTKNDFLIMSRDANPEN